MNRLEIPAEYELDILSGSLRQNRVQWFIIAVIISILPEFIPDIGTAGSK